MARPKEGKPRRGKSGTRKYGRNLKKCQRYRQEGRREKSKARRLANRERRYARNRRCGGGAVQTAPLPLQTGGVPCLEEKLS